MDDHTAIFLRVLLAFGLAVAGGGISAAVGVSHQRLCALISLAAGTLLGVTLFAIVPECRESMQWWELLVALASGYVVFVLISKYVYHVCPACAASHFDETTTHRFSEIAGALIIALGVHSTMDGIALVAGHEGHHHHTDMSMLLAICVHKIPEGLALGALLLGAGYPRRRAVVWVALVESTTLLGGLVGWLALSHVSGFWLNAVLAHAGGGFLFLAMHAVLGELVKHGKAVVLANFAGGVALIAGLHWVVDHLP
ncbi:MAG: Zinc transporter ZupT [Verrucomicrobiae bacterium]|nr:Zinc transporter ZupT [Verrucomicrobiae bacterium]